MAVRCMIAALRQLEAPHVRDTGEKDIKRGSFQVLGVLDHCDVEPHIILGDENFLTHTSPSMLSPLRIK